MNELNLKDVVSYVENNIGSFHKSRAEGLTKLKFNKILTRKNPYLFKAKNILTAQEFVKCLLDAHLSSQEESMLGNFLEGLAIFICSKVYDGKKSGITGVDLEFDNDGIRYIVAIKSGPNWGNSNQIKNMKDNFKTAVKTLRTSNSRLSIIAVNGCCYGRDNKPEKGEYQKLCGQRFWSFISGNDDLYTSIIEPLGHKAKEKNEQFSKDYSQIINKFTEEFLKEYCVDGNINWVKIVEINSATEKP